MSLRLAVFCELMVATVLLQWRKSWGSFLLELSSSPSGEVAYTLMIEGTETKYMQKTPSKAVCFFF